MEDYIVSFWGRLGLFSGNFVVSFREGTPATLVPVAFQYENHFTWKANQWWSRPRSVRSPAPSESDCHFRMTYSTANLEATTGATFQNDSYGVPQVPHHTCTLPEHSKPPCPKNDRMKGWFFSWPICSLKCPHDSCVPATQLDIGQTPYKHPKVLFRTILGGAGS